MNKIAVIGGTPSKVEAIQQALKNIDREDRGIVVVDYPQEPLVFKSSPPLPEIPDLFDAYPGGKAKRRKRRKAERSQTKQKFK